MIVYIAGRMAGLPDWGKGHFQDAADRLRSRGDIVLNPAELPDGLSPESYMPICLAMLEAADAVYMLSGWESSAGAQIEHRYVVYQKKKVFYED